MECEAGPGGKDPEPANAVSLSPASKRADTSRNSLLRPDLLPSPTGARDLLSGSDLLAEVREGLLAAVRCPSAKGHSVDHRSIRDEKLDKAEILQSLQTQSRFLDCWPLRKGSLARTSTRAGRLRGGVVLTEKDHHADGGGLLHVHPVLARSAVAPVRQASAKLRASRPLGRPPRNSGIFRLHPKQLPLNPGDPTSPMAPGGVAGRVVDAGRQAWPDGSRWLHLWPTMAKHHMSSQNGRLST